MDYAWILSVSLPCNHQLFGNIPVTSETSRPPLSDSTLIRDLVAAGIRAPSGDNCQPWAFRCDHRDQISVDILPDRAKSFFDLKHRATFLSVGAVVENIRVEAAFQGYDLAFEHSQDPSPESPAAVVTLQAGDGSSPQPDTHRAMLDRTVNRRPYFRVAPSQAQLGQLTSNPVTGTTTHTYTGRSDIRKWARLIYLGDRIRYSHPVIHNELFGKILLTREEAATKRMGLEYDRLGIGPGATSILKLLKPWKRMQRLSQFGVDSVLSNQSRLLTLSSGAIVLVTIPDNSRNSWLLAGQQVERLWIGAQQVGLSVHPMTVCLYLSQRYREEGMTNFLPAHEPWLQEIASTLDSLLGDRVGAMVFRLGKAMKMSHPAIRLKLKNFLPDAA